MITDFQMMLNESRQLTITRHNHPLEPCKNARIFDEPGMRGDLELDDLIHGR